VSAPERPFPSAGESAAGASPRVLPLILVVEDDPVVRFNLRSWLEDSGYCVDEAEDGALGLELALSLRPDLVLCDLRMPGLDGLAVLKRLREEAPELPAIAVSGTGVLGDAVEALRNGAWDFVVKPIQDMAVLEHAIGGVLERARLIRENACYHRELEQANRQLRDQLLRIEEDADAGRRIQLQLMPPAVEQVFGDYRFSRTLLPSLYLSGDFVDYFAIDPHRVGFFLADVSGHGVSSAFVTVLIKSFVQRSLERLHRDGEGAVLHPVQMLKLLNDSMLRQGLDKYLAIFYGVLDCEAGRLDYANAGLFPRPALLGDGEARFLPGRGMPVGLFPEPEIDSAVCPLPRGCTLVFCTDGVLEALPGGTLDERLAGLLDGLAGPSIPAAGLPKRLGLDPQASYPDDIAFLVLRRE
jgi:serine phosphatase RsbU (regulator of sigma subunit)